MDCAVDIRSVQIAARGIDCEGDRVNVLMDVNHWRVVVGIDLNDRVGEGDVESPIDGMGCAGTHLDVDTLQRDEWVGWSQGLDDNIGHGRTAGQHPASIRIAVRCKATGMWIGPDEVVLLTQPT